MSHDTGSRLARSGTGMRQLPAPSDDIVLAEWPNPALSPVLSGDDRAIDSGYRPAQKAGGTALLSLSESELRRQKTIVRRFERETRAAVDELLQAVDIALNRGRPVRLPPPGRGARQDTMLAALDLLSASGSITPREAKAQRRSLLALSESAARLAAMLQLYLAGTISAEELEEKRMLLGPPLRRDDRRARRATIDR